MIDFNELFKHKGPRSMFGQFIDKLKAGDFTAIVSLISGVVGLGIIVWLLLHPAPSPAFKKPEAKNTPQLSIEDAYAALFRYLLTDKVCYKADTNTFFVHFSEEDVEGDTWPGWWELQSPDFKHNSSNRTWYIANKDEQFTRIYPNVVGMSCALKTEYTDK